MGIQGTSTVEQVLRRVLVPICVISGVVVVSGFFFPGFVGDVVSGQYWLIVALLFFGSGLGYLAVLPATERRDDDEQTVHYLMRIRRLTWTDTVGSFVARHDAITFGVPVVAFALFFLAQFLFPSGTVDVVGTVQDAVLGYLDWLLVGVMLLSVLYCLFLLVGPWGDIRLGGPEVEPTYTYPVYFTMFFTAGIAAGIVFWGPAEAILHYESPPPFFGAEPQSGAAIGDALTYSLFHWGFSAWSAYLIIGLPIAYFVYERGAPLRVSTILTPFLGVDRLDSLPCRLVDMLAIFATIGGIATSVALVSQQFLTGINYQWGVEFDTLGPLLFVAGLTIIFVLSAQSGVHRGIRRIAGVNIALFAFFALLLFALAPRSVMFDRSAGAVGSYAVNFVPMSLHLGGDWVETWTIWNWSWWFSWAPFAGLFLAALSRGRKIRTVVLTGFVATSLATIVWFLLMGVTSLHLQSSGTADILGVIGQFDSPEAVAGFPIFGALPLSQLLVFLFLGLIIAFMVTSADTSTLVVAILASEKDLAPSTATIVFWGIIQGTVAVSVILTGSETTLQAAAVLTGGPFAIIALLALVGLTMTFVREERGHDSILDKAPALPFDEVYKK
ncbi:glycine/betaine ABC transporter [Halobacteriales archaeon QH_10_65_19]|nr:MAG: glycine/betaine ABC transporter [Halobacteriales archaeon QH_10_65_19]